MTETLAGGYKTVVGGVSKAAENVAEAPEAAKGALVFAGLVGASAVLFTQVSPGCGACWVLGAGCGTSQGGVLAGCGPAPLACLLRWRAGPWELAPHGASSPRCLLTSCIGAAGLHASLAAGPVSQVAPLPQQISAVAVTN